MNTNFLQHQEQARKASKWLTAIYVVLIAALTFYIYAVVRTILWFPLFQTPLEGVYGVFRGGALECRTWWLPQLFTFIAIITAASVMGASLGMQALTAKGGKAVVSFLGGRRVATRTNNPKERQLLNIVEELSIAAGITIPGVFVLPRHSEINAFCAGFDLSDSAIAVTRGCLDQLNRDELQAIVAHEFSHLLNGDARLNLRLLVLLHGILWPVELGRSIMDARPDDKSEVYFESTKQPNPFWPIGAILYYSGLLVVPFALMLRAAVSRQREFLADAGAVELTRQSEPLASVLRKILGVHPTLTRGAHFTPEIQHMLFRSDVNNKFFELFSTHPRVADRIARLSRIPLPALTEQRNAIATGEEHALHGISSFSHTNNISEQSLELTLSPVTAAIEHLKSIPTELTTLVHDRSTAQALLFSLMLDTDPEIREKQFTSISQRIDSRAAELTKTFYSQTQKLGATFRLSLVELACQWMGEITIGDWSSLSDVLLALSRSNGVVKLEEFALITIALHATRPERVHSRSDFQTLEFLQEECTILLSLLAHSDAQGEAHTTRSFERGAAIAHLKGSYRKAGEIKVEEVARSLDRLARANPMVKQTVLNACQSTVSANQGASAAQRELLRAISMSLECPCPL